jgi:ABC-type transporter Mla subunit MlaD
LRIDPDGSAMYISNANEKVEMYLEEAIQLFEESKWHDNVQGDLNTAMGEANLLLGRLGTNMEQIFHAQDNLP